MNIFEDTELYINSITDGDINISTMTMILRDKTFVSYHQTSSLMKLITESEYFNSIIVDAKTGERFTMMEKFHNSLLNNETPIQK